MKGSPRLAALAALAASGGVGLDVFAEAAPAPPAASPAAASPAAAGATPLGASSNAPIDITADGSQIFQPQRLVIFKGNVEAIQDQTRLRTPELRIYYKPKAPTAPGAKPPAATGAPADNMGSIDHIVALGPVYYITPTQNARGDAGLYEADPDTITLTGNVVLVQGKSVGRGDKLVINRKTGESNFIADPGKATNGRVRVILYPNQQPGQPGGKAPATAASPPASAPGRS